MNQTIDRSSNKPNWLMMVIAQLLIISGLLSYFTPDLLTKLIKPSDVETLANNAVTIIVVGFVLELIFIMQVVRHKRTERNAYVEVTAEKTATPIASKLSSVDYNAISRRPLKSGGANFKTHNLKLINDQRLEFVPSVQLLLFSLVFSLIGGAVAVGFIVNSDQWLPALIGLIFFAVGIAMYKMLGRNRTFDRHIGWYWQGSNKDNVVSRIEQCKVACRLRDIKAVQVIKERVSSNKGSYYSYEINLIRGDNSRLNVVDHGAKKIIEQDAQKLADFLRVPVVS